MAEPDVVGQQSSDVELPPGSAVDILLGCTTLAVESARRTATPVLRTGRSVARLVLRTAPPACQDAATRWLTTTSKVGRGHRARLGDHLTQSLDRLIPVLVANILDRLDLTAVVRERVDLDRLVALVDADAVVRAVDLDAVVQRLDLDEIAARIDLDAALDRVDLVGRAQMVIDAIDLPELIRESTGSVASETVRGVRLRGVAADDVVRRAADRLLPHRNSRRDAGAHPTRESGPLGVADTPSPNGHAPAARATGPATTGPATTGPATTRPATTRPATTRPDVVGPDVIGRDVIGPDVIGPGAIGPDVIGPDVIGPDTTGAGPGGTSSP